MGSLADSDCFHQFVLSASLAPKLLVGGQPTACLAIAHGCDVTYCQ